MFGKVKTTPAKAKFVRPFLEKLINIAKERNLTNIRKVYQALPKKAAKKLLDDIAPRFKEKTGGFLRIVRLPYNRIGDGAEQVLIELLIKTKPKKEKPKVKIEKKK